MDIYGFMVAGFMITMGTLGDRIGRRRLLLIGAAVFGVASVLAAYAPSPALLIAARALLGIAGATLDAVHAGADQHHVPRPGQRAMAIGIWAGCFMGGAILGPIVGGVLLRALLVGVGVPARRAGDGAAAGARPGAAARVPRPEAGRLDLTSVRAVPGRRSCRSSTASRSWPARLARRAGRARRWPAWSSAWSSCAGSADWPTRCWTCACSPTGRSAPRWCSMLAYTMLSGGDDGPRHAVLPAGRRVDPAAPPGCR